MKKVFIAFLIILMVGCQKTKTDPPTFDKEKDVNLISSLKKAYGLTSFNVDPSQTQRDLIFSALSTSNGLYNKIASKIQKTSIKLFENKSEGITIAIMRFEESPEKYYSIKGTFSKGVFNITNEFLFGRKLIDKNNGQIVITNNNEATLINFENGIETISQIGYEEAEYSIIQVNDCLGNHGGTGFCQREPGESFSACYNAEKAEFCTGFFSCLALDTVASVLILIASACSCGATLCP